MIHSPGFPESNYPDSSSCEWYFEGPTGHYLTLSYGNISLQNTPGCSADYVEIREYNASGKKTRGSIQLLFLCLKSHNQSIELIKYIFFKIQHDYLSFKV